MKRLIVTLICALFVVIGFAMAFSPIHNGIGFIFIGIGLGLPILYGAYKSARREDARTINVRVRK
jgi:hypothetical protein